MTAGGDAGRFSLRRARGDRQTLTKILAASAMIKSPILL